MKYSLFAVLFMGLLGVITAGASGAALPPDFGFNFDGSRALTTHNNYGQPGTPGWRASHDHLETPGSGHSEDATRGMDGALKLFDDNDEDSGGYKSSHLNYYTGENIDGSTPQLGKSGGIVMARVRNNNVDGAGLGFGYSTIDGNHTGVLGIQNDGVSITGWSNGNVVEYDTNGAAAGNASPVPGGNIGQYRVYALAWTVDLDNMPPGFSHTQYDVWVSNGDNWSENPADWTQIITNLHPRSTLENNVAMPAGAYPGDPAPPYSQESGILLGSFGPGWGGYGRTAEGDLDFDWLAYYAHKGAYGTTWAPWQIAPEPGTLALLGLAFCAGLRRRTR